MNVDFDVVLNNDQTLGIYHLNIITEAGKEPFNLAKGKQWSRHIICKFADVLEANGKDLNLNNFDITLFLRGDSQIEEKPLDVTKENMTANDYAGLFKVSLSEKPKRVGDHPVDNIIVENENIPVKHKHSWIVRKSIKIYKRIIFGIVTTALHKNFKYVLAVSAIFFVYGFYLASNIGSMKENYKNYINSKEPRNFFQTSEFNVTESLEDEIRILTQGLKNKEKITGCYNITLMTLMSTVKAEKVDESLSKLVGQMIVSFTLTIICFLSFCHCCVMCTCYYDEQMILDMV